MSEKSTIVLEIELDEKNTLKNTLAGFRQPL